ncbi:FxDxF family PEP-CTERM protein [Paucibacter sp. TC2R-5]|uniref:FxDxF family PEP-CTERM protein n=1 Tax=Paucibacter sp. TC2R-5 TaxID=2893555 RepID=UPI0021E4692D|nr:FxDxF family PEP-CTERM protein [Paucibacter sp. TC2R-5]MCV2360736.1 FxDxF family PEP-CTERM protein [Paucibacter sp. TC2R-5]
MKKLLIAALIAAPALAFADTNLIKNGSFEANVLATGSWNIYQNLDNWTGAPYSGSPRSGIELRNQVAGNTIFGSQYVELDTDKNSWMTQTFDTTANKTYELSFWVAQRDGQKGLASNGLSWSVNGLNFTEVAKDENKEWQKVTGSFVATAGTTTLTFKAIGNSDSYGTSLDLVSVTAAVPEPETYALMLAGLGAIGFVARRRSKQQ